jgi:hypothetical protein
MEEEEEQEAEALLLGGKEGGKRRERKESVTVRCHGLMERPIGHLDSVFDAILLLLERVYCTVNEEFRVVRILLHQKAK